jgi:hypothetical protein
VIIRITSVAPRGWTATAEHATSRITCQVGIEGDAPVPVTCTVDGASSGAGK